MDVWPGSSVRGASSLEAALGLTDSQLPLPLQSHNQAVVGGALYHLPGQSSFPSTPQALPLTFFPETDSRHSEHQRNFS